MKKSIRKTTALALCLLLLLSMSSMASAVTITWGDGTDARTLIMNTTSVNVDKEIAPAASYLHARGTETPMTYSGSYTTSVSAIHAGDYSTFMYYVNQAMSEARIENSNSITITSAQYTVPASSPDGSYKLFVRFACKDATWSVSPGVVNRAVTLPTRGAGTITHAPIGDCTIVGKLV